MNPGQLSAWVENNKVEVLGVAAAAVVLLGLRARKKTGAAPAAAQPAGTLPAAAVVPANGLQATGSTYDSSAYDVYSALQSELTPFLQQQAAQTGASSGVSSVPPVASSLFAPAGTGNYVKYGNGTIGEVESDGSVYGLSWGENWDTSKGYVQLPWKDPSQGGPVYGDKVNNLAAANPANSKTATG